MMTRRRFAERLGWVAAASSMCSLEFAWAQQAAGGGDVPPSGMVLLNSNENPAGPPAVALEAMKDALGISGRYSFQEISAIEAAIARAEGLESRQILTTSGSSEALHLVVDAFTAPNRPLIAPRPTFEGPLDVARGLGRPVAITALRPDYSVDVRQLVEAAANAGGGLIYLCNPNNPTSAITTRKDLEWLIANLPPSTALLVDEAYIHFSESPDMASALGYLGQGKDIIVTRTFSKIYGMAGLRVGFAAARADLISRLRPLRMGVISIVSARGAAAAVTRRDAILKERRAANSHTRAALCAWLKERNVGFIEPHGNFVMIDIGRPARAFSAAMQREGVAPGRPFPPLDNMLRVTIGADAEMVRFRDAFWKVYNG
jgi:histidinol-phosphate aminotransferase